MLKKYVSNRPIGGTRDVVGIGYVVIPQDQDSKEFVDHCFRNGTVSIALESGGVINNVLIIKSAINQIEFPEVLGGFGSIVVWINQPRKNQPIIIGSISKHNEFVNFSKNKSELRRITKNFVSEVLVDAQNGSVIITSNSSIEKGGDIYIISNNKNQTSKLVVNVSKDINIASQNFTLINSKKLLLTIKDKSIDEEITEISYEKGIGLIYKDEFKNEIIANSENIQLKPNSKLNVGEGKEPMMLSDTFKTIFEDFTDILNTIAQDISTLTVGTVFGPSTVPINATSFTASKTKLEELKTKYKTFQSNLSNTD